jgi:hypothetical protein
MRIGIAVIGLLLAFTVQAKSVKDTLREVEFNKNAKCFKTKETTIVCFTNSCKKNYDFLCVANSGQFNVRFRVNTYKHNGEFYEDVTKVIYLNK